MATTDDDGFDDVTKPAVPRNIKCGDTADAQLIVHQVQVLVEQARICADTLEKLVGPLRACATSFERAAERLVKQLEACQAKEASKP